jgi:hypothetical protein
MELLTEYVEGGRGSLEAKVIARTEGWYEPVQVPFGVVYTWHSPCVLVKCRCAKTLVLTCFLTTCSECGTDYGNLVREELGDQYSEDEALHPWRYANREGVGFSCEEVFMKELRELSD